MQMTFLSSFIASFRNVSAGNEGEASALSAPIELKSGELAEVVGGTVSGPKGTWLVPGSANGPKGTW